MLTTRSREVHHIPFSSHYLLPFANSNQKLFAVRKGSVYKGENGTVPTKNQRILILWYDIV